MLSLIFYWTKVPQNREHCCLNPHRKWSKHRVWYSIIVTVRSFVDSEVLKRKPDSFVMIRCFSQKLVLMNAVMVSYGNRCNISSCFSSFPLNVFSLIRSKCFHFHSFTKIPYLYVLELCPSWASTISSMFLYLPHRRCVSEHCPQHLKGSGGPEPHGSSPSLNTNQCGASPTLLLHPHTHTSFTTSHSVICFTGLTTVSTTAAAATQNERERRRSLVEEITFQTMVTVRLFAGISQERIQWGEHLVLAGLWILQSCPCNR